MEKARGERSRVQQMDSSQRLIHSLSGPRFQSQTTERITSMTVGSVSRKRKAGKRPGAPRKKEDEENKRSRKSDRTRRFAVLLPLFRRGILALDEALDFFRRRDCDQQTHSTGQRAWKGAESRRYRPSNVRLPFGGKSEQQRGAPCGARKLEQDGAAKGVVQRSQVSFHLWRYTQNN